LEIQNGASLTINPGKALTVSGILTNFGSLTIKSDASGTGSLISSTTGVDAKVEKFLTKMKWHFIGMPVESGVAGVFHLSSGHAGIYLKTHIESTNTWGPFIVPVTTLLTQGRGYECWVGNSGFNQDETIVFPGKLGAGNYTTGSGSFYALKYTNGHGLNLICNPYPSALQANIGSWSNNNIANKVWTWSPAFGNYVFWGSGDDYGNGYFGTMTGGVIPEMQAFFVEATGSNPSLTFTQTDRVHNGQDFYKDAEIPMNTLLLSIEGNNFQDAVFIHLNPLSTEGYDTDFDVEKLFGLNEAPQLYSQITGKNLSINSIPEPEDDKSIPLGFECEVMDCFTIEASGMDRFYNSTGFYLEDKKTGNLQHLNENPVYTFAGGGMDDPSRFILHFSGVNGISQADQSSFRVYSDGCNIHILNPGGNHASVFVFDIIGKLITEISIQGEHSSQFEVNSATGYYFVKVQSGEEFLTQKVFIR
jgi:hypothetical protein